MNGIQDLLQLIGGIGNAAGVQGAGPTGLNMLQRAGLNPEQSTALDQ